MPVIGERSNRDFLVYTDGACIGNPGPGGWGVLVIRRDGAAVEKSGGCRSTTNNRMELTAAIEGLRATPPGARVLLRSDSQLLVKTINAGWKRNKNGDLWDTLDRERIARNVVFEWVKGHDLDPHNARADELATQAAKLAVEQGSVDTAQRSAPGSLLTQPQAAPKALPRPQGRADLPRLPIASLHREALASMRSMLREGEAIARCAQCGREFVRRVLDRSETVCSLVACQAVARRRS